ncbi:hypothetical protein CR152_07225 [Massilia violaceinigra]|uniref:Flagellar assembly protein FliH n=1 Tax=Massilia violaceinigra TaxID=2045208 RepID=A0A2D2DH61_9BURK|nr:FliH/SctL family protein [Massilia violaceinigra]ATQ74322.1 hypothetical protein CR152_07225 [Massilia violaceinigra]
MGEIIRAAAVTGLRQLRRHQEAPARPAAPAPATATALAATLAAPAPRPAAPPPTVLPVAVAVAAQPAPAAPTAPLMPTLPEVLEAELKKLRAQNERDCAAARAEAERRGHAAGLEQGEAEGRQLLQAQVSRVKSLALQLVQAKPALVEQAEDDIVELAFAALCRILGERAASRDTLMQVVREAAAATREREHVGIRLHPDDLALLRQGEDGPEPHVRYSADATIALGGCIVDSSTGTLDARLETQIERLRATLVAVRAARLQQEEI